MNRTRIVISLGFLALAVIAVVFYTSQNGQPERVHPQKPSISYLTILTNPEFKQRLLEAVKTDDFQALEQLQEKAVEIGLAAGLPDEEMALISGPRGRDFMRFRAKRELFNQAFLYHYKNLLDIAPLLAQYPEAADLFELAQQTVAKRDELIEQIAMALAGENDHLEYIDLAREEWRKRNQDSQN